MKIFKKNPIISIVLGSLIITYALLAYFLNNDIFNLNQTVGNIAISMGLISFAILIILPDTRKKSIQTLKSLEFVIIVLAAIIGFILPLFNVNTLNIGSGSLWFGLTLVINGALELYFGVFNKKTLKLFGFLVHVSSIILGTWLYATNYVDSKLALITFLTLLTLGGYLIMIGLLNNKKTRRKD